MGWCLDHPDGKKLFDDMLSKDELVNIYSDQTAKSNNWQVFSQKRTSNYEKGCKHGKYLTILDALTQNAECANHLFVGCFVSSSSENWSVRGIKKCSLYRLMTYVDSCKQYFDDCYKYNYFGERPCFGFINSKLQSLCIMTVSSRKKHYSENYFSSSTLDEQLISRKFGLFDYSGSIAKIGGILNALADEWNQFVFEDDSSDQWQKIERRENTLQSIFKDFTTDYIAE